MSEKFTSLLAACALTFVVFAASSPAFAKQPITVTAQANVTRYVSFRDLNLVSRADEKVLVHRVSIATRDVCDQAVMREPVNLSAYMGCRAGAWQEAQPQIERAVTRAREIAVNGFSAIAPVAIAIGAR